MSELHNEGGMTFDQAAAAIEQAGQQEAADSAKESEQFLAGNAPQADQASEQPTPPEATPASDQPDPFASEGAEESFMGEGFNPDLLPDELQPGFKQLQGRWTQRMQEVAEQRKALEALGSIEDVQRAMDFYGSLQDPEYLKAFYRELGGIVEELDGGVPAVEEPAAEPVTPEPAGLPQDLAALVESDPDLRPFAEQMAAMRNELDEFKSSQAAERAALQEEQTMMAQAQEISRQVDAVREAHPEYGEEDWEVIYDLADARDGNVLQAADIFQAQIDRSIARWTEQKQTPHSVTPQPGAGTVSEASEQEGPQTLKEADDAALAFLQANDLTEFTG